VAGRKRSKHAVVGLLALSIACAGAPSARASVNVAVLPATQTVAPGGGVDVTIQVTGASDGFNAFTLYVGYDPAVLTPVQLSPLSSQIGALMGACGNRFHQFHSGGGTDTCDVSLLCAGVSVVGPGTIYKLHFLASGTVQSTGVWLRAGTSFADSGIYLGGVTLTGAAVGIGTVPVLAVDGVPGVTGLRLSAGPSPARAGALLSLAAPAAAGATVRLVDTQGRAVRSLAIPAGAAAVWWDGRTQDGARAAPGVYLLEARAGERRAVTRLVVTR
jgi:hypothetical protein